MQQSGGPGAFSVCTATQCPASVVAGTPSLTLLLRYAVDSSSTDGTLQWAIPYVAPPVPGTPPGLEDPQVADSRAPGYMSAVQSSSCGFRITVVSGRSVTASFTGCVAGVVLQLQYADVTAPAAAGPVGFPVTLTPRTIRGVPTAAVATGIASPSPPGTVSGSATLLVTAASPARMVFTRPPVDTVAGRIIGPPVEVAVQDRYGNAAASQAAITLTLIAPASDAVLRGTVSGSAASGWAEFVDLTVDRAATWCRLLARATGLADPGLPDVTSAPFAILAGPASALVFVAQPGGSPVGGQPFPDQPQVAVADGFGNRVASDTTISLAVSPGDGLGGARLTCDGGTEIRAVHGVAAFTGCALDRGGATYRLTAAAPGLASAISDPFDVAVRGPDPSPTATTATTTSTTTSTMVTTSSAGGGGRLAWTLAAAAGGGVPLLVLVAVVGQLLLGRRLARPPHAVRVAVQAGDPRVEVNARGGDAQAASVLVHVADPVCTVEEEHP